MSEQGLRVERRDGFVHVSGVINEYAEFDELLALPDDPLRLNIKGVSRINSIGIRNLLKFLNAWGERGLEYHEAPSEFVDQLNMIPAILGVKAHGRVVSLFVPYECDSCDFEEEILSKTEEFEPVIKAGKEIPPRDCPKCKDKMYLLTDSFFVFLNR